ncbi:copper chaperone PCu(A)C [[Mycobacterium] wendilense]|uniref:Copper chaperone PCu(A)C n=1 Tax=[Mycobacterium] wendilense TaxID=3064284 RepID=A0ABM9MB30_9MYCO|nr:copper chaperone PCu(A)C [Mycolicibacterium sp. MU0050]CAJ1580845.1 copper chaperone PCu(A)C [Mycolicibacterium sp. MU0050]
MNSVALLRTLAVTAVSATALLGIGCSTSETKTQAQSITVQDAWVKAVDADMTSAFARLTNDGGADARLLSATSPVSGEVEIHEVIDGRMQTKDDGLLIPAGGVAELHPGADHLMLMDLREPLTPGSDVEILATFEDGSQLPITAQVRDFAGAEEDYGPDPHAGHGADAHPDHGAESHG